MEVPVTDLFAAHVQNDIAYYTRVHNASNLLAKSKSD